MRYTTTGHKEQKKEASLIEFLLDLPYLLSAKDKLVPPLQVLNSVFQAGELNAGMSGF